MGESESRLACGCAAGWRCVRHAALKRQKRPDAGSEAMVNRVYNAVASVARSAWPRLSGLAARRWILGCEESAGQGSALNEGTPMAQAPETCEETAGQGAKIRTPQTSAKTRRAGNRRAAARERMRRRAS